MSWQPRTVNFAGTCLARSTLVLKSPRIHSRFRLTRILAHFAPGCQGRLALQPYISADNVIPATGPPTGWSVLTDCGQAAALRGDGQDLDLEHQIAVHTTANCLAVYAVNTDWYDHHVDVQLGIEVPGEEP